MMIGMRGMVMIVGLALVPACTLYSGDSSTGDGVDAAIVPWVFDAQPAADAALPITSCAQSLPCPSASPNRVTVCGRLRDVETDAIVSETSPTFTSCDLDNPTASGPCHLKITFYDALDFAGNPTGAVPLDLQAYRQDDCGRFVAENIQRPSLGFLGIAVDDAADTTDDHRLTGVAFAVSSGQVRNNQIAYAMQSTTDAAWAVQAGLGASTFADRGAVLTRFTGSSGTPVTGVRVISNGSQRPADDFYFVDTIPTSRTTVAPLQAQTGPNGASLLLNSPLVEHSGTGGAPAGCSWTASLAASIAGVIFVQHTVLESTTTGGPCEP